ncbi:hypothetical protein D3C81_2262230 [compost metagenome]
MADKLGVIGHNFEEKHIFVDNRIWQWLQAALVQLNQAAPEVIGFSADVIHQKGEVIAAGQLAA